MVPKVVLMLYLVALLTGLSPSDGINPESDGIKDGIGPGQGAQAWSFVTFARFCQKVQKEPFCHFCPIPSERAGQGAQTWSFGPILPEGQE